MKKKIFALFAFGVAAAGWVSAQTVIQNTTYTSGTTTVSDPTTIDANTNVTVSSGATVNLVAGTRITLGPGFRAANGSVFAALILPAPPAFQPTSADSGSVTLAWGASQAADHYDIYRNGVKIATVSAGGSLSYTDTGAPAGGMYSYTINAVSSGGLVSPASAITVTNPLLEVLTPPP